MPRMGLIGAGTMGGGIAQVALEHGDEVWLYDALPDAPSRALQRMRGFWQRSVEKGQRAPDEVEALAARCRPTAELAEMGECDWVIEAAPEDLTLKQRLFQELDRLIQPSAVLARNTSSLSITAIAAATQRPERVVGLHFFNPAPVMPLVEVVQGARTADAVIQATVALAERWGKRPVVAQDTPGFIVNRVARPFYLEALRLLGDGVADVPTIDRLVRSAGFRLGPFELLDLIGLDVNLAVTQSVYDATFGEPRFRPHPIQARLVAAGRLGRKTGGGFYPR
ncbi:MAG: 3-hydroxybutyryl-CoA dehydrogenase [Anaerolineae bacterium]|nr:3-hydroxybutyryl-CoA dehydrogenase [Anaerolineae bacterium]